MLFVLEEVGEGGGIPSCTASGHDLAVKLIDQGGDGNAGPVATGFIKHDAQVFTHPFNGEPKLEFTSGHSAGTVIHLPAGCCTFRNHVDHIADIETSFLRKRHTLRQTLHLDRPTLFTNPIINTYGGLVTRYPTWLAINPNAWQPQRSPARYLRGWTIYLYTQPRTLEFDVDFVPNPEKPSPAFHGIVQCVADGTAENFFADASAFPAVPELPEQAEPGVSGDCTWTPPGPGTVTIQARITNSVTLWVSGYTEPMPDYTWLGPPATFRVGELSAVNTND